MRGLARKIGPGLADCRSEGAAWITISGLACCQAVAGRPGDTVVDLVLEEFEIWSDCEKLMGNRLLSGAKSDITTLRRS